FAPTTAGRRGLLERDTGGVQPGNSPGGVSAVRIPTRVESTAVGSAGMSGRDDDEDDLPGMFATPAEELAYWRTHTIDGRCKPRKPIPIEVREPDLRTTRWTPPEDPFADLSYEEWKDGMQRLPALYWDPRTSLGMLMGRSWTPIRQG